MSRKDKLYMYTLQSMNEFGKLVEELTKVIDLNTDTINDLLKRYLELVEENKRLREELQAMEDTTVTTTLDVDEQKGVE